MEHITLKLRPEDAELLREALLIAADALEHSDRQAALTAHIDADDCSLLTYKLACAEDLCMTMPAAKETS